MNDLVSFKPANSCLFAQEVDRYYSPCNLPVQCAKSRMRVLTLQ